MCKSGVEKPSLVQVFTILNLTPFTRKDGTVERVRGAIPAPVLEQEEMLPSEPDSQTLGSMQFIDGKFYTAGNVNRRKYKRLEDIGWIKGIATNISDVEYHLTETGKVQLELIKAADAMQQDYPDPAPKGFQSIVNLGNRRGPILKLELHQTYQLGSLTFHVDNVDGNLLTIKLSNGNTTTVLAPAILLSPLS